MDADPLSPIRQVADHFATVPPLSEAEGFLDAIHALCLEWEIDCILPQNDRELWLLASARARFEKDGIRVAGVAPAMASLAADKLELAAWSAVGEKLWSTFVEPPWSYRVEGDIVHLDVMGRLSSFSLRDGP